MTTDPTPLQERLARAIHAATERPGSICRTGEGDWDFLDSDTAEEYRAEAAAVLPIIAAEVQAAKAEALRTIAPHLNDSGDESFLLAAADDIEKED